MPAPPSSRAWGLYHDVDQNPDDEQPRPTTAPRDKRPGPRQAMRTILTAPSNLNLLDGEPIDPRHFVRSSPSLNSLLSSGGGSSGKNNPPTSRTDLDGVRRVRPTNRHHYVVRGSPARRRWWWWWSWSSSSWASRLSWVLVGWAVLFLLPFPVRQRLATPSLERGLGPGADERAEEEAPSARNQRARQWSWPAGKGNDGRGDIVDGFERSAGALEQLSRRPDAIVAEEFLIAVDHCRPAYESLGMMFSVASTEVTKNVGKLRANAGAHATRAGAPAARRHRELPTLQDMVLQEVSRGAHHGSDSTFEALRWLGFGLHFMEDMLLCIGLDAATPDVSTCAQDAYDRSLLVHHGAALQFLSKRVLRLVPASRDVLLTKDRGAASLDDIRAAMVRWSRAVKKVRRPIEAFYSRWPPHRA